VPGRMGEAVRVRVRMRFGDRRVLVPYTLVRSRDGWLVEQIAVETITMSR
jgi:hypothetical protein